MFLSVAKMIIVGLETIMLSNILFICYVIFFIFVCLGTFTPKGQQLQYEYLAFRETKQYMLKQGIRWP